MGRQTGPLGDGMDASTRYAERTDAVNAQRERLGRRSDGDGWGRLAPGFVRDPRRELDANLAILAEYVQPDDVILDVGGGAGRVSLPLALRCREVISVEPSAGMCAAFNALAREAGITNARTIQSAWPVKDVEGDATLVVNVTQFVRDIVPFVEGLVRASRRRVVISVPSVVPSDGALLELVYGEPREAMPGHRELLLVLWEMGILPDVRVLPGGQFTRPLPQTPDEAVQRALISVGLDDQSERADRARDTLAGRMEELFERTEAGYRPRFLSDAREMLITWET
jgi:SAM-dependent methyltransferase